MAKNSTKAVLDNFTIKNYVDTLFESNAGSNSRLSHFLNEYQKILEEGSTKEFMLYEDFGHGLANFATGNKAVKNIINEMNNNLATYGKELNTYKLMECICDDAAKCACEDAYTHYLASLDDQSKAILCGAVDVLEQSGDPVAPQLTVVIANPNAQLAPQQISTFDSGSKFDAIQRQIEEDKLRQSVEQAKAEIDAYAEKKYAEMQAAKEAERNALVYDNVVNANGICLGESIRNIMNSEAKSNKKLVETLEQYKGALSLGLYEERLYEGFIKNITPFNYLSPVDKEIKRLKKVAEDNEIAINLTKILEEMYTTNSYYIIPLIEEDACRFIKNPTDVNCNQFKAALVSFAGDPYCNAMLEELEYFNNKPAFLVNDAAMTIKDRAKLIKEHANISNIYSPVQYVKENECVFNANGQFYVKKGNTLAKLSEDYIPELSENFIALCQLVNDPHVIINEDHITFVGNGKIANIYENKIDINGNEETIETVRNLNEMQVKYDFDNNFFIVVSRLAENFDNIANINFAKHVALNEDEGINIDLFNLNGNIFVNAVNESMLSSTFYHNVNPIQCRNLINNHMGINVASLFEDLIPSQEKFYLKLNETKDEYEASIAKYEATIEKLKKAKEENISEDGEKKLNDAIEAAQNKVDELKKEYKDWQDEVDKVTNPENKSEKKADKEDGAEDGADAENTETDDTNVEKSNEPIDPEDVEAAKADLTTPLNPEDGNNLSVTDDEFDTFLERGSEVPADAEEMDPTDVNMSHHALDGDGQENQEPDETQLEEPISGETDSEEVPEEVPEEDPFKEVDAEPTAEPAETPEVPAEPAENSEEGEDEFVDFSDEEPTSEPVETPEEQTKEQVESNEIERVPVDVPEGYKIANIKFDENLKTGELFKTGSICIITDMIKSDGTLYTKEDVYEFYINEETHLPVIEAADIPVALYNAMVASIQEDEKFNKVDAEGTPVQREVSAVDQTEQTDDIQNGVAPEETSVEPAEPAAEPAETTSFNSNEKDFPDYDDVYYDANDVKAASDELEKDDDEAYFDFTDDGNGDITFTAKEEPKEDVIAPEVAAEEPTVPAEPKQVKASDIFAGVEDEPEEPESHEEDVITPTYKEGDTVIDEPAENVASEEEPAENRFADENNAEIETDVKEDPAKEPDKDSEDELKLENESINESVEAPELYTDDNEIVDGSDNDKTIAIILDDGSIKFRKNMSKNKLDEYKKAILKNKKLVNRYNIDEDSFSINESVEADTEKLSLNEARQAFVKLKAEYKNAGSKESFLNEGTSEPSKKEVESQLNEGEDNTKTIDKLYEYAVTHAKDTTLLTDVMSALNETVRYFGILDESGESEPIAIYEMNDKIYYGNYDDLNEVLEYADDDYQQQLELLESDKPQCISSALVEDGYDLVETLLDESVKIKKPGLTTDGDVRLSQIYAEAVNGTKDRREFEKRVEREASKAGVMNPLLPQPQQESVNVIDAANELSESVINKENVEIIYEPMDWVIIKENGMKAQVTNVVNDADGKLKMLTILASNGVHYDADPDEIEPDPAYLLNIPGRTVNSTLLGVPRLAEFDINPETMLTDKVNNDDPALEEKYKDFNE